MKQKAHRTSLVMIIFVLSRSRSGVVVASSLEQTLILEARYHIVVPKYPRPGTVGSGSVESIVYDRGT